jgi:hypothetical protein
VKVSNCCFAFSLAFATEAACGADLSGIFREIQKGCNGSAHSLTGWYEPRNTTTDDRPNRKKIIAAIADPSAKISTSRNQGNTTIVIDFTAATMWESSVQRLTVDGHSDWINKIQFHFAGSAKQLNAHLKTSGILLNGTKGNPRAKISEINGNTTLTCELGMGPE